MFLADKIIQLRKKEGWSQEDLADQLDVSRQSVSKWESRASIPELDKILAMSDIFGVTTDYLLRDDIDEPEPAPERHYSSTPENAEREEYKREAPPEPEAKPVSLETASAYMKLREKCAPLYAFATALCILSPIVLILLGARAEYAGAMAITEAKATMIGMAVLLVFVGAAVAIFITMGMSSSPYKYIEEGNIKLDDPAQAAVEEKLKATRKSHIACIAAGVSLIILGVIPFIALTATEDEYLAVKGLSLLLFIVAFGVGILVYAGVRHWCYTALLQIEDYTPENKRKNKRGERIGSIYWPIIVAIYLGYSFITDDWGRSWIVWPVAGVLYAAVAAIFNFHEKQAGERQN